MLICCSEQEDSAGEYMKIVRDTANYEHGVVEGVAPEELVGRTGGPLPARGRRVSQEGVAEGRVGGGPTHTHTKRRGQVSPRWSGRG